MKTGTCSKRSFTVPGGVMNMRVFLLLLLSPFCLLHVSCKKYEPAPEAFFLTPGPVTVSTTSLQGSSSHNITDLWVYVNGKFQGAYPIGNKIPVITKGSSVSVDVFAGIENDGISSTRSSWLFLESLKLDTFVAGGTHIVRPFAFKYKSAVQFAWNENFEGLGFSVLKSPQSEATFSIQGGGMEGRYLYLGGNQARILMVESAEAFELPSATSNVFLEINYRCSQSVLIGLITELGIEKDVLFLNPSEHWNKIYVRLGQQVSSSPTSLKHKVFFRMVRKDGDPPAEFLLDNVKLVYIK